MATEISESEWALIELRQRAHSYRAWHAQALERERAWKEKVRQLEQVVCRQEDRITDLTQQNEALKAKLVWLKQQVFGRKSEQAKGLAPKVCDDSCQQESDSPEAAPENRRKRGKQRGAKGYGRRRRTELPAEEIIHELSERKRRCPYCGRPFLVFPGTEDSEEIHWEVRLVRRIHKRKRYRPICLCRLVAGIITAPPPPKIIPKGMFSTGFWARLLMEKFLFQRPLCSIRQALALEGLCISQGTLTGGLKRIGELFQPLYARILERSRAADHWHMDETRWMVFAELEGKAGHRWWLWVVITRETCVYLLDPSRSAEVPKNHLGEDSKGIISADRYSAYKALGDNIRVAFCWGHMRRDFIRVRDGYRRLRSWGEVWVTRIDDLFRRNAKRLKVRSNPDAFGVEDKALRDALASMARARDEELADATLHPAQRKVLESLYNHWEGLTLFVDRPDIPMDNNEAERRLRNPVVGRKNYYGSGSVWSGTLSAILFTIFQTLLANHIDPQKFLLAYFEACAKNGGRPPKNLDAFLPWNLSERQRAAWRHPEKPP